MAQSNKHLRSQSFYGAGILVWSGGMFLAQHLS